MRNIVKAALILGLAVLGSNWVSATILTWDPSNSGTGSDASGTWDNSAANWANSGSDVIFVAGGTLLGTATGGFNTLTVNNVTGLQVGQMITGNGLVYTGTTGLMITAINGNVLTLSSTLTGSGTYTNQAYLFSAGDVVFGSGGTAGTVAVSGTQFANSITFNPVSSGTYVLDSGTIVLANGVGSSITVAANTTAQINSMLVNAYGNGGVRVNGGGNLILNGGFTLATNNQFFTYGTGTVTIASGTYKANIGGFTFWTQGAYINQGAANVNLSGGALFVGYAGNQLTTYTVNDANAVLSVGSMSVGRGGGANAGLFDLKQGLTSVTSSGSTILIGQDNSKGTLIVEGGTFNATNSLAIVNNYNGTAAFALEDSLQIKGGVTNVLGVQLGVSSTNAVVTGTASLYVSGGTLNIGASGINAAAASTSVKNVSLSGGTVGALTSWSSTVAMTLSNANGGVSFSPNGNTITLGGVLSGTGGLHVTGGGTLLLSGLNTYTGNTLVDASTILQLSNGAQLTFVIGANGINNSLSGLGSLSLDGTFFFNLGSADTTAGDSWTIIGSSLLANTSYTANFTVSGFTNQGAGIWTDGIYQYNQTTGILSVVPEPSTWLLLGIGAGLLVIIRRQRGSKSTRI